MRSKSFVLSALLLGAGAVSHAQLNQTFTLGNYNLTARGVVVDPSNNNVYTYGVASPAVSSPSGYDPYEPVIVQTDAAGNYVNGTQIQHNIQDVKLTMTGDGGLLLAGYTGGSVDSLYIIKLGSNLSQQWSHLFLSSNSVFFGGQYRLDIARLTDPNTRLENYYIIAPHATNYTQFSDVAFSVTKVDETGTVGWRNVYTQNGRTSYGIPAIEDYASTISPVDVSSFGPADSMLLIGGYRREWPYNTQPNHKLFFQYIDRDGNPFLYYRTFPTIPTPGYFTSNSYPLWPTVLQDGNMLACANLEGNCTIANNPNNASGVGIFKMDLMLNPLYGNYIWQDGENYPHSLIKDQQGNYVVNLSVSPFGPTPGNLPSTLQLKVDPNSLSTMYLKKYSPNDIHTLASSWMTQDQNGNYYQAATVNKAGSSNTYIRMLQTDMNGNTCDAEDLSPNEINISSYNTYTFGYDPHPVTNYTSFNLHQMDIRPGIESCGKVIDWKSYRTAAANVTEAASKAAIHIQPNVVKPGAAKVAVSLGSNDAGTYVLADIQGRTVLSGAVAGTVTLDLQGFTPGVYVLSVRNSVDKSHRTERITVTN